MNGHYVQHDDVFRLVTQKMNKYRRIAIKHCLRTQSAFKQLSTRVLSIQFRGSTVGRWPPELPPRGFHTDECGFQDVVKKLQRDQNRWMCFEQHANTLFHLPMATHEMHGNTIEITPHTHICVHWSGSVCVEACVCALWIDQLTARSRTLTLPVQ